MHVLLGLAAVRCGDYRGTGKVVHPGLMDLPYRD